MLSIKVLTKILICHSRGINRESSFCEKQKLLDRLFYGYDGTNHFSLLLKGAILQMIFGGNSQIIKYRKRHRIICLKFICKNNI
jgi:hypothetical protein